MSRLRDFPIKCCACRGFSGAARMIQIEKHVASLLFSAALVAALGGCSTLEKHIPGIGAASGSRESTATEGVYYTGSPDLPLLRSPGGVIVTRLPQYTKVYREQLDRGFAQVRVDASGETGWVENAKLTWRRPKPTSPEETRAAGSQLAAESPSPPAAEAPESPRLQAVEAAESPPRQAALPAPSSADSKPTVAPSIFNPY